MSKLFSECAWEDDLPSVGASFSFSKKSENKKSKVKNIANGLQASAGETSKPSKNLKNSTGWSVLLPRHDKSKVAKPQNGDIEVANGENKNHKGKKKRKTPAEWGEDDNASRVSTHDDKSSAKKQRPNDRKDGHIVAQNSKTAGATQTQDSSNHEMRGTKPGKSVQPSTLREKLVERLKGSRFRFINEQLYKTTGKEAKQLFDEDPEAFFAYHEGYRHQIAQWSMNPLDRIIKSICKLPKNMIVADFGCGEARLADSIPNQTYSLDLVSHNSKVIACDMANTPLESNFVNVVVFCLSLMGTNLEDFLLEANRVLKTGGILKIAEVSSRFDNINEFIGNLKKCGFTLMNKDIKHKLFYFFNFKKERLVLKGSTKFKQFSLKPCLYKKR